MFSFSSQLDLDMYRRFINQYKVLYQLKKFHFVCRIEKLLWDFYHSIVCVGWAVSLAQYNYKSFWEICQLYTTKWRIWRMLRLGDPHGRMVQIQWKREHSNEPSKAGTVWFIFSYMAGWWIYNIRWWYIFEFYLTKKYLTNHHLKRIE